MSYNPYAKEVSSQVNGKHIYKTIELSYPKDKQEFFKYIIPFLKEEYGIIDELSDKIKNVTSERKKTLENFMIKFKTPNPAKSSPNQKPQLKNTRGKLPELIARNLLIKKHQVMFPCRISLEEEDPDMPKRGIDNFGFIFAECNGEVSLEYIVACEVKASDEKDSPPQVVHAKADSLFNSLKSISSLDERFCKAIASAIDKLPTGQYVELITAIAINLEKGDNLDGLQKKIVVAPFMIRPKSMWTENDYGKFISHCHELSCSNITYYIVTLDYGLVDFADEVYEELRSS